MQVGRGGARRAVADAGCGAAAADPAESAAQLPPRPSASAPRSGRAGPPGPAEAPSCSGPSSAVKSSQAWSAWATSPWRARVHRKPSRSRRLPSTVSREPMVPDLGSKATARLPMELGAMSRTVRRVSDSSPRMRTMRVRSSMSLTSSSRLSRTKRSTLPSTPARLHSAAVSSSFSPASCWETAPRSSMKAPTAWSFSASGRGELLRARAPWRRGRRCRRRRPSRPWTG